MEKRESTFKAVLIGAGIGTASGLLAGVFAHRYYQEHRTLKPSDILEAVKKAFEQKEEYQVEGSWIEYTALPWQSFAIETSTYRGGITCKVGDHFHQYEFIADAHTGSIIDIHETNG